MACAQLFRNGGWKWHHGIQDIKSAGMRLKAATALAGSEDPARWTEEDNYALTTLIDGAMKLLDDGMRRLATAPENPDTTRLLKQVVPAEPLPDRTTPADSQSSTPAEVAGCLVHLMADPEAAKLLEMVDLHEVADDGKLNPEFIRSWVSKAFTELYNDGCPMEALADGLLAAIRSRRLFDDGAVKKTARKAG